MNDLIDAKLKAIDFLSESINKPWVPEPDDNDPLRFEAHVYLANKGIINKIELGRKIMQEWDSWIEVKGSKKKMCH